MKTLQQYFAKAQSDNIANVNFTLTVTGKADGYVQFYIRPIDRDGQTEDFYLVGNQLIPAPVGGVVVDFETAVKADLAQFGKRREPDECSKCGARLDPEGEHSMCIDGGVSPNTPDGPGEPWAEFVYMCPECGHQF